MKLRPKNADQLVLKFSSAPLIIYGMGYVGNLIAEWCVQNGISYIFCDKNAGEKRAEADRSVILPEQLVEEFFASTIVVASINYQDEIMVTLRDMGIEDNRILSYLDFWPEKADWDDLEASVDWDKVRKRAEIFAAWVDPTAEVVSDYSLERRFLQNFLRENVQYQALNYVRFQDNVPYADFSAVDPAFRADVASCLAVLMSFRNPEAVIDHLCTHTETAIIASYVPLEKLPNVQIRRSINYNNDYTEQHLLSAFEKRGFLPIRKVQDPFDAVHTVYLFEKQ